MEPSRKVLEARRTPKKSSTSENPKRNQGGYSPNTTIKKHEIPKSCRIKPRDISFVRGSIFLLVP